jgi:RNA polymerase sigma factor (sigma-70 family)
MTTDDAALLARYAESRDAGAFAEMVRRHAGIVHGTCLRILGNAHDAEDVAQECFMDLAMKAGTVKVSLPGWLHAAATSRSIDKIRSSARRRQREDASMSSEGGTATEPTWEAIAPAVDQALEELPEDLRVPLILHYLQGRDQAAVAEKLGVSQSTVSRRLEAGVDELRGKLSKAGVIASVAVLTSMLDVHGATAAPVSLTAALGKIALAGIGQGTAPTTSFLYTAAGKILAVVVVGVIAAGIYVAYKKAIKPQAPVVVTTTTNTIQTQVQEIIGKATNMTKKAEDHVSKDAPNILNDLQPVEGNWRDEPGQRVGMGWPGAFLASEQTWPGDAVVVEYEAKTLREDRWGNGMDCFISPYPSLKAAVAARATIPCFTSCGSFRYMYSRCFIYQQYVVGDWSRDLQIRGEEGDFSRVLNRWYTLKAERIGRMLRLYVNGVPVYEVEDKDPPSQNVHVMLGPAVSDGALRSVKIYRPGEDYIKAFSRPVKLFEPYQQSQRILARYPDEIVRETSLILGENNEGQGMTESVDSNRATVAETSIKGRSCRRTAVSKRLPEAKRNSRVNFRLDKPEEWNPDNEVRLEVEYLDNEEGDLVAFFNTWWYEGVSTGDRPRTGTGEWKRHVFVLRDAAFGPVKENKANIALAVLRANEEDLYVHRVRIFEVAKPKAAYEEVVKAYDAEIAARQGEWTVPHYMFYKALILLRNLDRREEAERILAEISQAYPDCECLSMYQKMRERWPQWPSLKQAAGPAP